ALAEILNQIEAEHRGFAFEGAAMAISLQDKLSLRAKAFQSFVDGVGRQHIYMVHVGAGWAFARLPWLRTRIETVIRNLHPVLRWLVIDGFGFHEGYFHWKNQPGSERCVPGFFEPRLSEHGRHVFFQGLGRSLWFIKGANVKAISSAIAG